MLGLQARGAEKARHARGVSPQHGDDSTWSGIQPAGRRRLDLIGFSARRRDDSNCSVFKRIGWRSLDIIGVSARGMEMTQHAQGFGPQD